MTSGRSAVRTVPVQPGGVVQRPGGMTLLPRASSHARTAVGLLFVATLFVACDNAPVSHGPSASPAPSAAGSEVPSDIPAAHDFTNVPTACLTLAAPDCERARAFAATKLTGDDPAVRYIQVGPFGCATGERCPGSLAVRPEGDVVIEFADASGINVHLEVAADGSFQAARESAFGIQVAPASPPAAGRGPTEFTLGHCGVFSGIDFDGSWWDPVGPVAMDSGEAVNATTGILAVSDPDHATFTSPTGFVVQLLRRDGPKLLPFCA